MTNHHEDRNRAIDIFLYSLLVIVTCGLFIAILSVFLKAEDGINSINPDIEDTRQEIDLNIMPRKHTDAERKVDSSVKFDTLSMHKGTNSNVVSMSPPNVTYKHYCVNGYLYIMFILSYGWNPETGKADRIETQIQQQFNKYGRAILCK